MATWNVLTLNGTGYQVALVRELKRYKIAIAGLTEARLSGSGEHDIEDGHLLYSGGTEKGKAWLLCCDLLSTKR